MRTGLLPIIRDMNRWLLDYYDVGLDPISDEAADIRTKALLIVDQLERLRARVQIHQMESVDE